MSSDRLDSDVLVIDASFIMRLMLQNPEQLIVKSYFEKWYDAGYIFTAPSLLIYEVTSVVNKSIHFKVITEDEGTDILEKILSLDIDLVQPNATLAKAAFEWTRKLKRASAYDSFYLALADQYNAPLWTADGNLLRSANVEWIHLGTE